MKLQRVIALAPTIWLGICLAQQSTEKFRTRLAPVAMDSSMRSSIAGTGSASATLSGNRMTIAGTFAGLRSPATAAKIHIGRMTAVRGPAMFDLMVASSTGGSIEGAFDLTTDQIADLKQGKFYIQIDSEKAPEGNLWGWLLR